MALDSKWKELLLGTLKELGEDDFEEFKFFSDLPQSVQENPRRVNIANALVKKHGENTLEETIKILEKIGNKNLAEKLRGNVLEIKGAVFSVHDDDHIDRLKADLQEKLHSLYSFVPEGNTERWQQQPLADVYTDLDVTYGADVRPDERHEVLQMETRAAAAKKSILPCDIFKSHDGQPRPIRTLLTVGFAGIGKTFLVQKFVCDWASGNKNQDVHFIFPFTFRELNTDEGKNFTLAKLIRCYVCESRHMSEETLNIILDDLHKSGIRDYESSRIKILFVLDGLDECKFKMDLKNEMKVDLDVTEAYPLEILLAHIIKRNLLPCARVWITTRPATARDIPSDLIDSRTEVRGFNDSQRLEYFRKKFQNEERVIEHIRKTRTIFIMCHLPIFCWLTATVLQDHLDKGKEGELPTTLTDMYSEYAFNQLDKSKERQTTEYADYVKALAKLAFHHTMSKQQIFYEEDLAKSGFDYNQAAKHSGIFTEVFKEVRPLRRNQQGKMFQFVHLTIQEYFAAFHVMICLFHDNKNILVDSEQALECVFQEEEKSEVLEETESEDGEKKSEKETESEDGEKKSEEETESEDGEKESEEETEDEGDWKIAEVHRSALQKASESEGYLDMFLRFLLGLSLPCNQELVGELLKAPQDCRRNKSKTVKLIKERIKRNTPEKNINLFYCLNELKDDSLLKQFQIKKNISHHIDWEKMPNDMWSALAFFLLTDDETMEVFQLYRYTASPLGLEKLLVVVKASQRSSLHDCQLDKGSCDLLASVLCSPSNLRHLDLSFNNLLDEGVEILSKGLASPNCVLESLYLRHCGLGKGSCHLLASVLSSPSNLKSLNLGGNNLSDKGVEILSKGLASPHCKLESLFLMECGLSKSSCHLLTSVPSYPSNLSLNLSKNNLSDEGVEILSKGLSSPNCKLESLNLRDCHLDKGSCHLLASVLSSPSNLKRLDLTDNNLLDEGVEILSKGLASPNCTLEELTLSRCHLDKGSCHLLASVLSSPSNLRHLNLSYNNLSDEGVEILSKGLASPNCKLESLDLSGCELKKGSCHPLASVLSSPSNLKHLELSWNDLSDEGIGILSKGLASPHCKLESLELSACGITNKGCVFLAEALMLNPSHLQQLSLWKNPIGEKGKMVLLNVQEDPSYRLETVRFELFKKNV
ncbi:NACHT, LRR and PYD domains-containing protein 3-like isoform X1 [Corythoichthys intestinalis]|uniref:NACHT, LRR and PYD domains-containing protein 3-like isoform X1 n=2 Tax=Corythoichthys intestinalis TaxID=161448 RepID=UPI0025A525EF|nr:NACHT, LRR and PYD domains-containing protein 3-like isoform X1 [Corythoichthys intestinalis]XP_057678344.1 NACHT, LRR and PYD domains-containing protein 3-like isoform X1 [Corythoichthys intestinalis]XP_057678416.1 NACHT, LRR and PYD domains-containing protein 3-like isoform X1 [Corythoichthys intestinalis]XP_061796632.1 NACHT, LRR and PYD domains-containing protein 3-like [Nerophis lumbriciformis]